MYEKGILQKNPFSLKVKRIRVNMKTYYQIIQMYSVKNFSLRTLTNVEAHLTGLDSVCRRFWET